MPENPGQILKCPQCGANVWTHRGPLLTVDVIITLPGRGIVLIERRNPPYGWALPGGFVDAGETLEQAAIREMKEETSLDLRDLRQFRAYSDPARDPRHHTVTMVFTAIGEGTPKADDDAKNLGIFQPDALPSPIAFDHGKILRDYFDSIEKP